MITANIKAYRYKTTNGTLNIERKTLNIMDDKQKIAQIDSDETDTIIRYQLSNHLGSASLELDENADIISYEEYHPFGTSSYRSGRSETEVSLKRYKYVGKERDEETGLYYYGARYYASWLGRFVSVAPMAEERNWATPYNYVQNNPIMRVDTDGRLDGWVIENINGEKEYWWDDRVNSQEDLQKYDYEGIYGGNEMYQFDNGTGMVTHYTKEGMIVDVNNVSLTSEGELELKIDEIVVSRNKIKEPKKKIGYKGK